MESSETTTIGSSPPHTLSPSPSSSSPPPSHVIVSPCAACKILRRRCAEKCVLAPYFPPTDPLKFTTAHRVFGASNIIKFLQLPKGALNLQDLPDSQRADAVSSMVYEANARLRDPVYGCAGAIFQLQKQVGELQAQLAKAQAELLNMQSQQANLVAFICMEMAAPSPQASPPPPPQQQYSFDDFAAAGSPLSFLSYPAGFGDELSLSSMWESLLT